VLLFVIGQVVAAPAVGSRLGLAAGGIACVMLALALTRLAQPDVLVRHSEHLDWAATREACASAEQEVVLVPIQFDGVAAHAWRVGFPSARCRALEHR
jgi:hypothetical protein